METKSSKSLQKKQSANEKLSSNKKVQGHSKKKKKHRRKSDGKDAGKSSTSPDTEVVDNVPDESDTDRSAASRSRPLQHIPNAVTKYSEAIATLKQNKHKHDTASPRPNSRDLKSFNMSQTSSSRYMSPVLQLSKAPCVLAQSKGVKREPIFPTNKLCSSTKLVSNGNAAKPSSNGGVVKQLSKDNSTKPYGGAVKSSYTSAVRPNGGLSNDLEKMTLRWEYEVSDPVAEETRLSAYKLNRRLRYLAESNMTYSDWLSTGVTGEGAAEIHDLPADDKAEEQFKPRRTMGGRGQKVIPGSVSYLLHNGHKQDIMMQC